MAASRHGTALRYDEGGVFRSMSWGGWDERSRRVAASLISLDVAPGERVAIICRTRARWAVVDVGILLSGAVTAPIYPTLPPAEVNEILRDSGACVAFFEDAVLAASVLEDRPKGLRHAVVFANAAGEEGDHQEDGVESWDDFLARGGDAVVDAADELARRRALTTTESLATIVYTSGTSGEPKGVELTHGACVAEVDACGPVFPVGRDDVQLLFLPLAHIFARLTLFMQMRQGFTTAFSSGLASVADDFLRVRPTFVVAVPRLYEKIQSASERAGRQRDIGGRVFDWAVSVGKEVGNEKKRGLIASVKHRYADRLVFEKIRERLGGRIRFLVSGAAPLAPETAEFFFTAGLPLFTGYGLTETAGAVSANAPDAYRIGTVGRVLPGVSVAFAEDGEILVRGANVMRGYHNKPEETARAIDPRGWLHTGDLGRLDADGYLSITGRKKDLLITAGGKIIAPRKLESALEESKYIAHAVVVADRRLHAVALLVLSETPVREWARREGISGDYRTLIEHPKVCDLIGGIVDGLNTGLAPYETIKRWKILPRNLSQDAGELTPTMKVRRKAIERTFKREITALYR